MSTPKKKRVRKWIVWTVASIWVSTALIVFALTHLHPSTLTNASLTVREFSFDTTSGRVLSPANEDQLLIAGIAQLKIEGSQVKLSSDDEPPVQGNAFSLVGDPSASCTFYHVRSSGLELSGLSRITLARPSTSQVGSFTVKSHGPLTGNVASQPSLPGQTSGFSCTHALIKGVAAQHIDGTFSDKGGDSALFISSSDVRIDFRGATPPNFSDTQLPVLAELRFSTVEPGSSLEEKTTLLRPPAGENNEVSFEECSSTINLNSADVLVIDPSPNFYLREFKVKDGITLSLHGTVKDVRVGAGSADLKSRMPSLLDHLDNEKRIFGLVPAIAALIVGALERMGVLPSK
ncbi:MAG: hypothetical protein LAO23_23615 [Acidobacteriia bacterium]|nr:hypothetical protein [Terriglobia bacterium]